MYRPDEEEESMNVIVNLWNVRRSLFAFMMAVCLSVPGAAAPAHAEEQGVTGHEIVIGMSNALTGPAAALGIGVKDGAMVYFNKLNAAGGVNGRKIRVISYDDGYEPKRTVENTNKLVNEDKVFALFGYVGTPTSTAVLPIINKEKMIYWAPFTGAEFLRTPVTRTILNVRGSYFDEADTQVKYLTEKMGKKRIGMFIQNDAYGLSVKGGVVKALKKRGMELTGEGVYERNTENVDAGLSALKTHNPDAVIMVGTYKAMAAFIKKAKAQGFNPVFLNVSFVGTAALVKELGGAGEGVIITQVIPSPRDSALSIVQQYRKDMKAAGHADLDYTDLEGYIDAVVFSEALKKAANPLTRDTFITAAESLNATIGGLSFSLSPSNHQAMSKIYLTKISGSKVVEVEK
jgi:ABC-type branched-subunit amino acid transport system substrate-binding protein